MKKYKKKFLFDYIMGNDMGETDINELEKDPEFIIEVTDLSNDKNIYNLCDQKLKQNFRLMKFLILKFKDDKKFAKKVARDYIENSQEHDDDNEFEINIIISNLYGRDCDDIRENKNLLSARLMYEELKINYFIQSEKNSDDLNDYNQMGFNIFNMMYENRKIIVDYIAKKNG